MSDVSNIRFVRCGGSPWEMGLAQGSAFRDEIREVRSRLADLEAFRAQRPWWVPYGVYLRGAEKQADALLRPVLAQRHAATFERLDGISQNAGVSLPTLLLFNGLEAMLSMVEGVTAPLGACSAVAVSGARSAEGEPVIARNFDYLPLVQPYYIVRESRPETGYASLEFTMAPFAGVVDGINEAGLAIAYNYAFTRDEPQAPAAPISVLIAEALLECDSVEQALERITACPRWGGAMLMLADESGDVASLELSSTAAAVRRPADGEGVIFHTNCFFTDAMQPVQISRDAVYTNKAASPLRGRRLHDSSKHRDARLRDLLDGEGSLDLADLARIMSDHGPDDAPDDNTICMHGSYWHTTASLQLLPGSRRIRVSNSTACAARYEEFEL